MTYYTMYLAHTALMNEFNTTQTQLAAVNKKLKEAAERDKAFLRDPFGDPMQNTEYEDFQKKVMNLRAIKLGLSKKVDELADAIADFDKHDW